MKKGQPMRRESFVKVPKKKVIGMEHYISDFEFEFNQQDKDIVLSKLIHLLG